MSEILSQSEIDALVNALTSGEVKAEDIRDAEEVSRIRNYDFRRAMRFSKDHIRIISRIHDYFARLMTTHLSGLLRSIAQIQVESVDQVPYEEFIRSMPPLTVIQVFDFSPLEGKVVMEMNPQIVFAMLDRVMGGTAAGPYKERELTEIEGALLNRILGGVTNYFTEAWRNITEIHPEWISTESNPQFLQLTTPNETVLVVTLSAKIGGTSGLLNICIPHVTLEPVMPKLSAQHFMDFGGKSKHVSDEQSRKIGGHLRHTALDVWVELGCTQLNVVEVLDLQPGDVIPLNAGIRSPVKVYVGNVPTFTASVGKSQNRYAIRILEELREVDEDDGQHETVAGGN